MVSPVLPCFSLQEHWIAADEADTQARLTQQEALAAHYKQAVAHVENTLEGEWVCTGFFL